DIKMISYFNANGNSKTAANQGIDTFASKFLKLTHPIKISAVSYLNTKPLLYGIERAQFSYPVELSVAYPSLIAKQLQEGSVDIGLVPVAAIPTIPNARIISDYGIAG